MLLFRVKLKSVSNMFLGHDQEVIVTDGAFGSSHIEMGTLAPQDQIPVNRLILKAEPTVFVLLLLDSLELEVDLQRSTLQDQHLIECDELLSSIILCKLDKTVWVSLSLKLSPLPALDHFLLATEILEVRQLAMLEYESFHLVLCDVAIKARHINQIAIAFVEFTLLFLFKLLFLVLFIVVLILSLEQKLAKFQSAALFTLKGFKLVAYFLLKTVNLDERFNLNGLDVGGLAFRWLVGAWNGAKTNKSSHAVRLRRVEGI
jgi:hypothetical protein